MKNEQIDGNKEMIAFGFMNIVGSFTSCYLTTGINHSIIFFVFKYVEILFSNNFINKWYLFCVYILYMQDHFQKLLSISMLDVGLPCQI